MKPTREWDGRIGRVYWRLRRGKIHTHMREVTGPWVTDPYFSAGWKLTHMHHFPRRRHEEELA